MKIAAWFVLALPMACGGPESPPPAHFTIRDSADVVVVEADSIADRLSLGRRLYRVGGVDGPQTLFRVTHAFLTPSDGVAVVETSSDMIRVFSSAGQPVRAVGRQGSGPGEFRGLWWAAVGPGDSLIAFDGSGATTISVFDSAGRFARSFPTPHVGQGEPIPQGAWSNGNVLMLMQGTGGQVAPGEVYTYGLYSVAPAGTVAVDLGHWPVGRSRGGLEFFAHRASFAVAGEQLFYSPGDRFEVRVFDENGQLERISSRLLKNPP